MKLIHCLPVILILVCSSCNQKNTVQQYSEEVSETPQSTTMATANMDKNEDPHAFMKNLGAGGDPHAGYSKEELQTMLQDVMKGQGQTESPMAMKRAVEWTVPQGWLEKPATGMRMATFVNKANPDAIDCSIVTLGPAAGGIEPNIIRWIQQLKMDVPDEPELKKFINQQSKIKLAGGLEADVFDFTLLQKNAPDHEDSMLAAMIDTPQQRIFVKMTGKKAKVLENQKSFLALVKNLKFNN